MDKTQLAQIRQFNRDYVLILGILNNSMKNLDFSLTEGRVLFEIHDGQTVIANKLAIKIGLDRGYLNRIIKKLEQQNSKFFLSNPNPLVVFPCGSISIVKTLYPSIAK